MSKNSFRKDAHAQKRTPHCYQHYFKGSNQRLSRKDQNHRTKVTSERIPLEQIRTHRRNSFRIGTHTQENTTSLPLALTESMQTRLDAALKIMTFYMNSTYPSVTKRCRQRRKLSQDRTQPNATDSKRAKHQQLHKVTPVLLNKFGNANLTLRRLQCNRNENSCLLGHRLLVLGYNSATYGNTTGNSCHNTNTTFSKQKELLYHIQRRA